MQSARQSFSPDTSLEKKRQLIDESRILRLVERANTWGSKIRCGGVLPSLAGRSINMMCARSFDLVTLVLLITRRCLVKVDLKEIAHRHTRDALSDVEGTAALCRYVFERIAYARSVVWIRPHDVLRLGYGDCKCQANLLHALLRSIDRDARVVVGITGHRRVHAWVEVKIDKSIMVCDPTLSPRPLIPEEYAAQVGGAMDVSREYAMKNASLPTVPGRKSE